MRVLHTCNSLPACRFVLSGEARVCLAGLPGLRAFLSGGLCQTAEDKHSHFFEVPPGLVPWRRRPEAVFRPTPCQLLVSHGNAIIMKQPPQCVPLPVGTLILTATLSKSHCLLFALAMQMLLVPKVDL
jgi:hypothetical protein